MSNTLVHPWKIDPRTGLALRAVGLRPPRRGEDGEQPIWPIMGGSGEDDEDDDDEDDNGVPDPEDVDDEDDEDDEDGEDDPWAGKSEADLKAELKRLSGAHGKAKTQAQRWREFAQGKTDTAPDGTKRTATKPTPPKPSDKTKPGALTRADLEAAVEEARNEARAETREATIRTTARAELRAAGLTLPSDPEESKAVIARAVRLLDLDDVSVEDGEVVGLDDAIADLKRMLPGMFKAGGSNGNGNGGRRRAPNPGNTGGGKGGSGKAKTATEQQAALIFGGS